MYSTAYITVLQQEYKIMLQKAVAQLQPGGRHPQRCPLPQVTEDPLRGLFSKIPQASQNVFWAILFSRILPALSGW